MNTGVVSLRIPMEKGFVDLGGVVMGFVGALNGALVSDSLQGGIVTSVYGVSGDSGSGSVSYSRRTDGKLFPHHEIVYRRDRTEVDREFVCNGLVTLMSRNGGFFSVVKGEAERVFRDYINTTLWVEED